MTERTFSLVSANDVLTSLREDLHLERTDDSDHLALVAQSLRRICGIFCPCTARTIVDAAFSSLRPLIGGESALRDVIKSVLETLRITGDVIDIETSSTEGEVAQQLVHCVPPSYLTIGNRVYLIGVAPDDAPVLPSGIASLVNVKSTARYIEAAQTDQMCEQLCSLGLRTMTPEDWFRKSNYGKPANFLARMRKRLDELGVGGDLQAARVLAPNNGEPGRYKPRWVEPAQRTGLHIVRAERTYGADAWLLAKLEDGRIERSVLLSGIDSTMTRSCDVAWMTQLALDAVAGNANTYHLLNVGDDWRITLNFPLPINATRRLLHWSERTGTDTNDYHSFHVPDNVRVVAERFLQEQCWMQRSSD